MEENKEKIEGEDFNCVPSVTYGIRVGCGKLYITICSDKQRRFKRVFIPRNSKFSCDLTVRDGLARLATFQGKRSIRQLVRDLGGSKGHHCEKYSVSCEAASCQDAVAKSISRWLKVKRKRKK